MLVLAGGIFAFTTYGKKEGDGSVVVTVEGKEYGIYDLKVDQEVKIINSKKDWNLLEIKNGKARVYDASCKNHICVKSKKIDKDGESIVCLPNKVIVKVVAKKDSELDAIS